MQRNDGRKNDEVKGVKKSSKKAVNWLEKAAVQGSIHAEFELGRRYDIGEEIEKSSEKGLEWLIKAAEHGDDFKNSWDLLVRSEAQSHLVWKYKNGSGVEQSDEKALQWEQKAREGFQKSAEKGNEVDKLELAIR